ILNDYAVAQLELGERQGERQKNIQPYLRALEAVERSLIAKPSFAPALFNRALIFERLNVLSSAQRAWARYLTVETDTSWQREARSHKSRLARQANSRPWTQGGRDLAFRLLADWGRALRSGDHTRADQALDSVRRVSTVADSLYGDRTVRLTLNT